MENSKKMQQNKNDDEINFLLSNVNEKNDKNLNTNLERNPGIASNRVPSEAKHPAEEIQIFLNRGKERWNTIPPLKRDKILFIIFAVIANVSEHSKLLGIFILDCDVRIYRFYWHQCVNSSYPNPLAGCMGNFLYWWICLFISSANRFNDFFWNR
jgi:hypothetical protein